jgi:hypothetical protein
MNMENASEKRKCIIGQKLLTGFLTYCFKVLYLISLNFINGLIIKTNQSYL